MISVKNFRKVSKSRPATDTTAIATKTNKSETKSPELQPDLYRAFYVFLIISEIFVCAPMGAHRAQSSSTIRFRLVTVMHYLWCLLVYSVFIMCAYREYMDMNIDLPTVQKPLYFCEYLVYLLHIALIIVMVHWAREKFRQFAEVIIDFDQRLQEFNIQPNYEVLRKFLTHHLLLILLHLVVTSIIGYYYTDGVLVSFLRSTTVYMLPNLILHLSLAQYYGLLHCIAWRALKLNWALEVLTAPGNAGYPEVFYSRMQKLRLLYANLETFTKEVNDSFGPSVVLVYIGSFVNISVNIFLLYKYIVDWKTSDLAWIMYSVNWTCMHIGKMFLIVYYNHCIQNQKNTTALHLNNLKVQNADAEETITHFILQLIINTRSNVACGVAVLSMELIPALLIAISTLFIFLLQYDITFEALTQTSNSARPNFVH